MNELKLLTTKQVCDIYGVTRECVRLWRGKGLEYVYKGPRKLFYDERVLESFIKSKTSIKRKVIE